MAASVPARIPASASREHIESLEFELMGCQAPSTDTAEVSQRFVPFSHALKDKKFIVCFVEWIASLSIVTPEHHKLHRRDGGGNLGRTCTSSPGIFICIRGVFIGLDQSKDDPLLLSTVLPSPLSSQQAATECVCFEFVLPKRTNIIHACFISHREHSQIG